MMKIYNITTQQKNANTTLQTNQETPLGGMPPDINI